MDPEFTAGSHFVELLLALTEGLCEKSRGYHTFLGILIMRKEFESGKVCLTSGNVTGN